MDPSTTDTTTTMSDNSTQTPTLFPLPLELRHQIYNHLLHSDGNKTVYMGIILDPTSDLDPHHPSHRRVPDNYAPKSTKPTVSEFTFYIKAGVFTEMTLKPYAVALKISRTYTVGSRSYRDGDASAWVKDDGPAQVLEIACTGYWFEWEGATSRRHRLRKPK
ncbi:hypothetical protein D6D10_02484 [Aureobasidium pullulans]|uniref:Uncharacterized protein n=1 Tax=Aureobasidium pullulans TaxID=5580 RepID=A0A4S9F2Q9_AURPU|nr:hypothetical protein D6D10_02484 [Aureobasidium pullulans]